MDAESKKIWLGVSRWANPYNNEVRLQRKRRWSIPPVSAIDTEAESMQRSLSQWLSGAALEAI